MTWIKTCAENFILTGFILSVSSRLRHLTCIAHWRFIHICTHIRYGWVNYVEAEENQLYIFMVQRVQVGVHSVFSCINLSTMTHPCIPVNDIIFFYWTHLHKPEQIVHFIPLHPPHSWNKTRHVKASVWSWFMTLETVSLTDPPDRSMTNIWSRHASVAARAGVHVPPPAGSLLHTARVCAFCFSANRCRKSGLSTVDDGLPRLAWLIRFPFCHAQKYEYYLI